MLNSIILVAIAFLMTLAPAFANDCTGLHPIALRNASISGTLVAEPDQAFGVGYTECTEPKLFVYVYDQAQIPAGCYQVPAPYRVHCFPNTLTGTLIEIEAVMIVDSSDPTTQKTELQVRSTITSGSSNKYRYNTASFETEHPNDKPLGALSYDGVSFQGLSFLNNANQAFTGYLHVQVDIDPLTP